MNVPSADSTTSGTLRFTPSVGIRVRLRVADGEVRALKAGGKAGHIVELDDAVVLFPGRALHRPSTTLPAFVDRLREQGVGCDLFLILLRVRDVEPDHPRAVRLQSVDQTPRPCRGAVGCRARASRSSCGRTRRRRRGGPTARREQRVGGAALETGKDVPIQAQSGQGGHDDRQRERSRRSGGPSDDVSAVPPRRTGPTTDFVARIAGEASRAAILHGMHPLLAVDLTTTVLVIVAVLAGGVARPHRRRPVAAGAAGATPRQGRRSQAAPQSQPRRADG